MTARMRCSSGKVRRVNRFTVISRSLLYSWGFYLYSFPEKFPRIVWEIAPSLAVNKLTSIQMNPSYRQITFCHLCTVRKVLDISPLGLLYNGQA
jgi:hypothetical protein